MSDHLAQACEILRLVCDRCGYCMVGAGTTSTSVESMEANGMRTLIKRAVGCVGLMVALVGAPASAKDVPVQLAKVEAVPVADAALEPVLRAAFSDELQRADFQTAPLAKRYRLSAALLKLDSKVEAKVITSTCVVSVTLRNQDDVLVAIIQGRATAESNSNQSEARAAALRGAVRSAVTKVPPALSATERRG